MSDKLSEELLARHEANSRPESPKAAIDMNKLPSLPKAAALPSLPSAKSGKSWASAVAANKTAAPNRVTEIVSFNDLDKKDQISAFSAIQKTYEVTLESSRSSNGTTTILIRGPAAKVADAKKELNRRLSPRVTRKIDIAAEARAGVLGNRGATVRQLSQESGTTISVGDVSENSKGAWSMRTSTITITGSEQAVKEVVAKINAIVEKAPASKSVRSGIPSQLAPFVDRFADSLEVKHTMGAGPSIELSGSSLSVIAASQKVDEFIEKSESEFASRPAKIPATTAEFLPADVVFADHGVVIVDGTVLYGPAGNLDGASKAIDAIVKSTRITSLDISRAHDKTEQHAKVVGTYLVETGAIESIQEQTGASIKLDGTTFHISGKDDATTAAAKKALIEEVNKITPSNVLVLDGFKTRLGVSAAAVPAAAAKSKYVIPVISEESTILFYKGNDEDFAPSQEDITATLKDVAASFAPAQEAEASIIEKKINLASIEQRYLKKPLGDAKAALESLIQDAAGVPLVDIAYAEKNVAISGLKRHVEKFIAAIPDLISTSKDYQQRSNYTETVKFDPKHIKNLIGRNGSNISKLREEYDVKIDVGEDGQIILKGLESNVRKARVDIGKTEARLNDEVTEKYHVPQKYHATLIGGKGKFVRRIKDKYDVHVQFPNPNATEEADTIVLTGPSKGVAQTKKEFKDLVEYEETHSQVEEITVPSNTLNRIIGRNGSNITALKQDTNTQIDVSREKNEDGTVTIKLTGEKKGINSAAKQINAAVEDILDNVEKTIDVESKYHRFIVGPNNETRRSIIAKAGGKVDPWNPRTLQVPQSSSTSTTITITGPSKVVESIEKQVIELVEELKAKERCSETFNIPGDQVTVLLGPAGSRKRDIEEKNGVSIDIKRGPPCIVTIKGPSEDKIASAKADILSYVSLGKATVKVPTYLVNEVFNRGMLRKDIENKFSVRLVVNKSKTPDKDASVPNAPDLGADLYAVEYAAITPKGDDSSTNWALSGKTDEACQEAADYIESLVKKLSTYDTIGYVWFSKPNHYSQVIGPMGANINRLRTKSDCSIFVSMNARENLSPIEIRGVKANVEAATKAVAKQAGISV